MAALAAAAYGTNPAFAVPLYEHGMNPVSVLLFRYVLGLPLVALLAISRGRSLKIRSHEAMPLAVLGVMMALSSLLLFGSYEYMNAGLASTLLFIDPVLVAVIMTFFFHEKFKWVTGVCLMIMAIGLTLLTYSGGNGISINGTGFLMVMLSSLTYALYMVMVNVNKTIAGIPTIKLLFYVIAFGSMVFVAMFALGTPFTLPVFWYDWLNLLGLAAVPTVISLMCTTVAIQNIGSTSTAIFGALEPVTAVLLSVFILGEAVTTREIYGGMMIILASTLVVVGDNLPDILLRVRKLFPPVRKSNRSDRRT